MSVVLLVLALAGLVLVADLLPGAGTSRGIASLVVAGLVAIFAASFVLPAAHGLGRVLVDDAFTRYIQQLVLAAGIIAALGSTEHADRVFPRRQGEYYLLILCSLAGMTVLAGARELVLIVVAFELMGIPLYVLAAMHKQAREGIEGATKLYLTGAVSAAVTMYGLSFVVGAAGTTRMDELAGVSGSPMLTLGGILVLAGMAYKLGAIPFHFWVADTYQSAPTPFVAFLSVAPKVAAFAVIFRLFGSDVLQVETGTLLLVVGVITMIGGNFLALPQANVRRLLAFSGVGHVGLLMIALALGTADAKGALLFYLATYVAGNMGAFLVAEVVGGEDVSTWNGLARSRPGVALAMLLFLLSLAGIPFVGGFWAKLFVFRAAWDAGATWIVLTGALVAVLGLFYYLKVARAMYMEEPVQGEVRPLNPAMAAAIALCVIGIVAIGLVPGPVFEAATRAGG